MVKNKILKYLRRVLEDIEEEKTFSDEEYDHWIDRRLLIEEIISNVEDIQ